jgi:hypothetical protein
LTSKRTIKELRILPPFAIGRLGSADTPMDNYTIDLDVAAGDENPLDYRTIKLQPTLFVNEQTGRIEDNDNAPPKLEFKQGEDEKQDEDDQQGESDQQDAKHRKHVHKKIRPVAPFLEVFAVTDSDETLVPLTVDLLKENGVGIEAISWSVQVANRKVARRTGDTSSTRKSRCGITASIGC